MPRYALLIEYDGAPFCGWQAQADCPSVQATIEAALARLTAAPVRIQGAGRTDTGVHASGQVAHVDLDRAWEPFRLTEALNAHLRPAPVAILAAREVTEAFHARFSAQKRHYLYRILERRAPPALERGRVWHLRRQLDVEAMRAGAAHLVGRHDFTTFRASICQAKSPVKTLDGVAVTHRPAPGGREIRLGFSARSFLHNQVRSMVGTLVEVGRGRWRPEDVAAALDAKDRAACGPVAPPHGLVLTRVDYPEDPFADIPRPLD